MSVMDYPALQIPSSGTPLAHWNQPPKRPRAVARLDLLMASQGPTFTPCVDMPRQVSQSLSEMPTLRPSEENGV
jgi:hypothetical protein